MPPETTMVARALMRREGRLLLGKEMEAGDPSPQLAEKTGLQLASGEVAPGTMSVADLT